MSKAPYLEKGTVPETLVVVERLIGTEQEDWQPKVAGMADGHIYWLDEHLRVFSPINRLKRMDGDRIRILTTKEVRKLRARCLIGGTSCIP